MVEAQGEPSPLDARRREAVVRALHAHAAPHHETRTVLRPLAGERFQRVMTGLWVLVFLPLGLFLLLQALIFFARPAH
jgi:hypothetical protein